jgi:hypothetical protein
LIADFYYTAWVDAGKPNLDELHKGFSDSELNDMKKEQKQFKKNVLLASDKLIAKKSSTKEEL